MKLIDRISLIVRANVGSLIGRSADGPTDRQRSIRNGERELTRAREALAKAVEHQKALADQIAAADERARTWAQKAERSRTRMEKRLEETDRLESRLEMLDAELGETRQQVAAEAAEQAQEGSAPRPVKPEGRLATSPPAKKESALSSDLEARKARLSKKDE
jgi:chromosome segregation ATPase